ncbi:unnamed protein product [Prorocentrum cordatum]|uniref:Uncharacterized protein n=1 Tax=Prorocentrum cordatum TaxID=2364126 RepID=A0ABN9PDX1_9DINO|nr:unnamed protein product [Polarella glacialis]
MERSARAGDARCGGCTWQWVVKRHWILVSLSWSRGGIFRGPRARPPTVCRSTLRHARTVQWLPAYCGHRTQTPSATARKLLHAAIEPDFFSSSAEIRASACDKAEAEQDDQFPVPPPLPAAIFASAAAEEDLSGEAELDTATVAPDPASDTVTNADEDAHIVEVEEQMNSWARKRSASRSFLTLLIRRCSSLMIGRPVCASAGRIFVEPGGKVAILI